MSLEATVLKGIINEAPKIKQLKGNLERDPSMVFSMTLIKSEEYQDSQSMIESGVQCVNVIAMGSMMDSISLMSLEAGDIVEVCGQYSQEKDMIGGKRGVFGQLNLTGSEVSIERLGRA